MHTCCKRVPIELVTASRMAGPSQGSIAPTCGSKRQQSFRFTERCGRNYMFTSVRWRRSDRQVTEIWERRDGIQGGLYMASREDQLLLPFVGVGGLPARQSGDRARLPG
jgi:hypothetical protein